MIEIQTTAEVQFTCYLTDEDEEKVKTFMKENQCDLEDAVKELYCNNELNIYSNSIEGDFNTDSIDCVEEIKE